MVTRNLRWHLPKQFSGALRIGITHPFRIRQIDRILISLNLIHQSLLLFLAKELLQSLHHTLVDLRINRKIIISGDQRMPRSLLIRLHVNFPFHDQVLDK